MAQTGFTPIQIYSSSTPTNAPSASNLTNSTLGSELAINIADKNLFFKDSTNAVNTVPIRQSSASSNGWLSSTDWNTFNNKVTSVSGTAPVVSSGGTTPVISMAAATTSVNGYLTSTDWNTFNNKVSSQWVTSGSNIYYNTGNVAIGTSTLTAGYKLDVVDTATNLRIRSSSTTSTNGPILTFWHEGNDIFTLQGGVDLKFLGGGLAELMRIGTSSGNVTVNTGNLVIGTSGKGIDFSATPGTGTSELLADYEEGTWTATLGGATTDPTIPVTSTSTYTKIGRAVTVFFRFSNVTTTGASGFLIIKGLPYVIGQFSTGDCVQSGNGAAVISTYAQPTISDIYFLDSTTAGFISISAGTGKFYIGSLTYFV